MRPAHVLASVLALSTVTSAWPWPPSMGDLKALAQENGLYQKRQDNGNNDNNGGNGNDDNNNSDNNASPSPSASASAQPTDSGSAKPSGSAQPSGSGKSSGSAKSSDAKSDSDVAPAASSNNTNTYTASITAGAQPGGVNFIQPNTQSTATMYYKVDNTVTWIWNYTSLSRPPAAIDVIATVSGASGAANPSPFTLATNLSFDATQTFKWDTGEYVNNTSALPVGTYTLQVFDAGNADGVSATASAGFLAPYNQFRFGLYTGQPATSLATAYQCATCNSASGVHATGMWVTVGIAATVTVTSFCAFAGSWGVL